MADNVPIPASIAAGTNNAAITNTAGGAGYSIPINQLDKDLGIAITQYTTNNGTSNNIYGFNYQVAGQWTTTLPLLLTNSNFSSNSVTSYHILTAANRRGVSALRLDYFSTAQTNPVYPTNISLDYTH